MCAGTATLNRVGNLDEMFPDDATLVEFGRAAWAGVLAESCLKKACRNLTPKAEHHQAKRDWLRAGRAVLADADDRASAVEVAEWLDSVEAALDERDRMLHGDRTQIVWSNGDGDPIPGALGILNRRRTGIHVTEITPGSLRIVADRITRSIDGWERIHDLAKQLGGWL